MGARWSIERSVRRRGVLLGVASLGLLLWGLAPASAGPGAAPPAAFSNGVAKATAIVSKVAPGVGALELGISNGVAVAELKNKLGQAQAQSVDLGLIGTTLTAEGCRDATITPDDLPQPTRVDNRKGDAAATSDELPLAGSALGSGRETASATTRPSAAAVATSAASVSPLLSLGGGRAEATVEVIDGAARQAHATVDADRRSPASSTCAACTGTPSTARASTHARRASSTSARRASWACRSRSIPWPPWRPR